MGIKYSEREITSIGFWLSINGHFKEDRSLLLHWLLIFTIHLGIYLYFMYEIFVAEALDLI